jgi:hypothetical protein
MSSVEDKLDQRSAMERMQALRSVALSYVFDAFTKKNGFVVIDLRKLVAPRK